MIRHSTEIPKNCCWANFLRNHDELILRYIDEKDVNLMHSEYANNTQMLVHGGIKRRLAPLLGNNLAKLELAYALIFSVPGSPVIYYGDEIGMGDNPYLVDRNGLRTPMQWNTNGNAGFSEGDVERLYLPLVTTPAYHYDIVNVKNEENKNSSLLGIVTKMIRVRKINSALRRGSIEFLQTNNTRVIALARKYFEQTILSILNLSADPQRVEIDLKQFKNMKPVEIFRGSSFPTIQEHPYFISLPQYGYFWFHLKPDQ